MERRKENGKERKEGKTERKERRERKREGKRKAAHIQKHKELRCRIKIRKKKWHSLSSKVITDDRLKNETSECEKG